MRITLEFDLSNPVDLKLYRLHQNSARNRDALISVRKYLEESEDYEGINQMDDFMVCYEQEDGDVKY